MKFKILAAAAALLLAAGCSSDEASSRQRLTVAAWLPKHRNCVTRCRTGSLEDFVANVGDRVFFGYDRYDLTPEAQALLQAQVAWLQTYPQYQIVVEGHCDERGTREYNLALASVVPMRCQLHGGTRPRSNRIVQAISYGKGGGAGSDEIVGAEPCGDGAPVIFANKTCYDRRRRFPAGACV
jgi:peptidoglycan-associated lipoprotein